MTHETSYIQLFGLTDSSGETIERIRIPIIQRDYAQGREGPRESEIRANFLEALFDAIAAADRRPTSLDFVYGDLKAGSLQLLDGQQRLTTLFLLHWYLASRCGELATNAPWTKFVYATRPSAERFCERLATATPPPNVDSVSEWITDQAWYLFVWRHDPTIQSMLGMIDAIHTRFRNADAAAAWAALADDLEPAVTFHVLPLPDMGSADDLYIKMNSRGKPLTEFENFKAHFEKSVEWSPEAHKISRKFDERWTNILWTFRGDDNLVDDEFMRYLEFVTEICEWSDDDGESNAGKLPLTKRTDLVFADNPRREEHLRFLTQAFDVWHDRDVAQVFNEIFKSAASKANSDAGPDGRLPLFFRDPNINLFESCCRSYGDIGGGGNRRFTFGQTLILYGVVLHLAHDSEAFGTRIRQLRNLIEGSVFEMRAANMPRLVAAAKELILNGTIPESGKSFSAAQIDDETAKREFLKGRPASAGVLHQLEDHPLLKGSLPAFRLDAELLPARVAAFESTWSRSDLWSDLAATLLAVGEYQRWRGRTLETSESFQFGSPDKTYDDPWRLVLTGATRKVLEPTREVLDQFLESLGGSEQELGETLANIRDTFLHERESRNFFDWRYYMVKYPDMRDGASGIYFAEGKQMGYGLTNLRGGQERRNSNYRDPYLLTIWRLLGSPSEIADPWFLGYEWNPRYMTLKRSGVGVRAVSTGFHVSPPTNDAFHNSFTEAFGPAPDGEPIPHPVSQTQVGDHHVDSQDRIQEGVQLVQKLLDAGL